MEAQGHHLMFVLLGILFQNSNPVPLNQIVFSAKSAYVSKKGVVTEPGHTDLYNLNLTTNKIRRIVYTAKDLSFPHFIGINEILAIEHDGNWRRNRLVSASLGNENMRVRTRLPAGQIERITIANEGKDILVFFLPGRVDDTPLLAGKVVHIHNFKVAKILAARLDACVETANISTVSVGRNQLWIGDRNVPLPSEVAGRLRNVAIDDLGNRLALCISPPPKGADNSIFTAFVRNSRSAEVLQTTLNLTDIGDELKGFYWLFVDPGYPTVLRYDRALGRFLLLGNHSMSDGWHKMTLVLNMRAKKLEPFCVGQYLGKTSAGQKIVWDDEWLGEYKRGGKRSGGIFLDSKYGTQITPKSLDVCEADGI